MKRKENNYYLEAIRYFTKKNAFGIKGSLIPESSLTFLIKGPNPIRENTF